MNNFDKLHAEQDEFIKKVFQEDKIVSQPVLDNFTSYIENSNIKVKRYSYKQRNIIFLLLILLIISVGYNIYLIAFKNDTSSSDSYSQNDNSTINIEENIDNENNSTLKNITNSTANTSKNETNNVTVANITLSEKNNRTYSEINVYELEDFIEEYSVGIERISYDKENLESNTILLLIAKKYFDTKSNKSSLSIDTTYASSIENIHTYLSELTGKDYSNVDHISSYNNYIGYASSSNSYIYGKDYTNISKEIYDCSEVTVIDEENDIYTAAAKVTRTVDEEKTDYEITFTFKVNENYTYQKYNILSLKAKNTSFSRDNTIHLVDFSEEEDEN